MAEAEVGDDGYGEDPTVTRLESLAAALLGKEAALLTPSGTMANQIALRLISRPGTEVLCGARSHVIRHESAAHAANAGVQLHALPDADGRLDPAAIADAAMGRHHHLPVVSGLVIENTAMAASGRPVPLDEVEALAAEARRHGLAIHCDGARIWNAAIALGVAPADLVRPVDTVMFCLSKGLGAPIGSLLCGPADWIATAREHRSRLGGGMRQGGIVAAAGIVALETMVERLADDHRRAQVLATALADAVPGSVAPASIHTNIVCADRDRLGADVVDRLATLGVRCGTIDPHTVRFVTHKDVDDDDIAFAAEAFSRLV